MSGGADDDISGLTQSAKDSEYREYAYREQSSNDVTEGYGMDAGKIAQANLTGCASPTSNHRVQ